MSKVLTYKIVHNGYKINYVHTMEEVEEYINKVLDGYRHLNPVKVMDRKFKSGSNVTRIVRYIYDTIYEEDFLIDYTERS